MLRSDYYVRQLTPGRGVSRSSTRRMMARPCIESIARFLHADALSESNTRTSNLYIQIKAATAIARQYIFLPSRSTIDPTLVLPARYRTHCRSFYYHHPLVDPIQRPQRDGRSALHLTQARPKHGQPPLVVPRSAIF